MERCFENYLQMFLSRARPCGYASGRGLEEVPSVLQDARRGSEDREADGGLQSALLSLQSRRRLEAKVTGHGVRAGVRDNNAQHRSSHTEFKARATNASRRFREESTRNRRLRRHRQGHTRRDLRQGQSERIQTRLGSRHSSNEGASYHCRQKAKYGSAAQKIGMLLQTVRDSGYSQEGAARRSSARSFSFQRSSRRNEDIEQEKEQRNLHVQTELSALWNGRHAFRSST